MASSRRRRRASGELASQRSERSPAVGALVQQRQGQPIIVDMFFAWTADGGPLSYVLLALILLQQFPDLVARSLWVKIIPISISLLFYAWQSGAFNHPIRQQMVNRRNQARGVIQEITGIEFSNFYVSSLIGAAVGSLVAVLIFLGIHWFSIFMQVLAFGVFWYNNLRGPLLRQRTVERQSQAKLHEIAELVQTMPIENFVPEETMLEGSSISQLKQMLLLRGSTKEELDSFVDRQNMMETLKQRRQYTDTCCICFETYKPGEPVRILPKCCHELHIECLDKWAYTFASSLKQQQDPTCPLCKAGLK